MAGRLDLGDLDNDRNFNAVRAYNASKLENILFTQELHRRYHARGLATAAFHPGLIASNLASESDSRVMRLLATNPIIRRVVLVSPDQGADQLVWLAETRPGTDWESGTYYEKRKPAKRANSQARDADLARGLWERSEKLIG